MAGWLTGRGLLAPLVNRVYRHLFYAQVLSLVGTGLATVALALLAYDLAGERAGAVLGTALAIKMIAYVGVAPFAATFAQRFPRRPFLVALDLIRAAVVLALPFITEIWQVYVLIFVLQSASASFTPTFRATIPDVLPDDRDFTKALSLSRMAYDLEALLSPVLASALLAVMSFHWLFAGTAVGFILSACLVVSVVLPSRVDANPGDSFADKLSRGVRVYLKTPRLRGVLAIHFAVASAGAMVIVNTVVLVRDRFGGEAGEVALMMAAAGCGSFLMAFFMPSLLEKYSERIIMAIGAAVLAACMAVGATVPDMIFLALLWLVYGAASSAAQTPTERLLRNSSSDEDRPGVYAAQFALSHACWLIAYPAAGWLGAMLSLQGTFLAMAGLAVAGLGAALAFWPRVDPMELTHTHDAVEHSHWHSHDEHHQHGHSHGGGTQPHAHPHAHGQTRHSHAFVIDRHHADWPTPLGGA